MAHRKQKNMGSRKRQSVELDDFDRIAINYENYDKRTGELRNEDDDDTEVFICSSDWMQRACGNDVCVQTHMQFYGIVFVATMLGTGVMIDFIAFSVYPNGWWAAFVFIAYFVAGVCHMMFRSGRSEDLKFYRRESGPRRFRKAVRDGAYVLLGMAAASAFTIPLFLSHNAFIRWQTNVMVFCGTTLVFVAGVMYIRWFEKPPTIENEDYEQGGDPDEDRIIGFDFRTFGCVLAGIVFSCAWWIFIDGVVFGMEKHKITPLPWHYTLPGIFASIALVMLNWIRLEDVMFLGVATENSEPSRADRSLAKFLRAWAFLWLCVHVVCIISGIWIMVSQYSKIWTGVAILLQPIVIAGSSVLLLYSRSTYNEGEEE